jgi:hypothetical protein
MKPASGTVNRQTSNEKKKFSMPIIYHVMIAEKSTSFISG